MLFPRKFGMPAENADEVVAQNGRFERVSVHAKVRASMCRGCGELVACSNDDDKLRLDEERHECAEMGDRDKGQLR